MSAYRPRHSRPTWTRRAAAIVWTVVLGIVLGPDRALLEGGA